MKKYINTAFTRFLVTGLINTGLTYLLYLLFLCFVSYKIAYTCSFVLGIMISYTLNAFFVFRTGAAVSSAIRFPLVYLTQYLLGLVLVTTLVEVTGIAEWAAPIFAIMITVPLTFILSKLIFLKNKRGVR